MTDAPDHHESWLLEAVKLSCQHMRANRGGPFGAVIVHEGSIVARGYNRVTSSLDPTAHAEVVAIREACQALGRFDLRGCTIYSSCEPCPMCLGAIYWARLDQLYFANTRQEAAAIGFDDEWIYEEVPRAIEQRNLPTFHRPLAAAREVFEEWRHKSDKIEY